MKSVNKDRLERDCAVSLCIEDGTYTSEQVIVIIITKRY